MLILYFNKARYVGVFEFGTCAHQCCEESYDELGGALLLAFL